MHETKQPGPDVVKKLTREEIEAIKIRQGKEAEAVTAKTIAENINVSPDLAARTATLEQASKLLGDVGEDELEDMLSGFGEEKPADQRKSA